MRHNWFIFLLGVVWLVLGIAGCGGGGSDTPPTTLTIPAAGGTVQTGDAKVKLVAPAGAVASDTAVTIVPAIAPPSAAGLVPGSAYDFGPAGTTFTSPVTLTLSYDPAALPAGVTEDSLQLETVSAGAWGAVPGSAVNVATHTVSAPVSHFSTYGLLGTVPPYTYVREFSTADQPMQLALDGAGGVYVVGFMNHVFKYDTQGNLLHTWGNGSQGDANDEFNLPVGVAYYNGSIFVGDNQNHRTQKFNANGDYAYQGTAAAGGGCVTADASTGTIYSTPYGGGELFRHSATLNGVSALSYFTEYWIANPSDPYSGTHAYRGLVWSTALTLQSSTSVLQPGAGVEFGGSSAVTYLNGRVYLASNSSNKVYVLNPSQATPNFEAPWSSAGAGPGQFAAPQGLATDGTNIYVADTNNNRIQKFTAAGQFICAWGTLGNGHGQLSRPRGVAVDPGTGLVYVSDSGNNRVEVFQAAH